MRFFWVFALVPIALLFCFVTPAYSLDVTLAWDGDLTADGYKIYYKPGEAGGRKLENYNGKDAAEGASPINLPLVLDENPDPNVVEFTLHDLADNKNYVFVVTAYNDTGLESTGSREIQILGPNDIPDPYNRGWRITAGHLNGFTVYYHESDGIIPTLGPTDGIPPLNLPSLTPAGASLNMQPSGAGFGIPVTISIPLPAYGSVEDFHICLYEDGIGWILAWDGKEDSVQPGAVNWLATPPKYYSSSGDGSRIEIQVYHFSGVQAAVSSGSSQIAISGGGGGGGGGCFIAALHSIEPQ